MSPELSPRTCAPAYARFTPSHSGQRSPPTCYRGCWHVVSRGLFSGYRPSSSPAKGVYDPKAFFPHAASLGQAFAHCPRFPAAASRRSPGRVSVPVWPTTLSGRLPVIGLVGHYPTNYLMGREPLPRRHPKVPFVACARAHAHYRGLAPVSRGCPRPGGRLPTCYSAVRRYPKAPEGAPDRSTCMP